MKSHRVEVAAYVSSKISYPKYLEILTDYWEKNKQTSPVSTEKTGGRLVQTFTW